MVLINKGHFVILINAMQEKMNFKLNRILSALIDGLFIFIILILISIFPFVELVMEINKDSLSVGTISWLVISIFAGFLLGIVYLFVTYLIFKNATLGMKITHLTFVKYDGNNPAKRVLFIRSLLVILGFIFSLGFICIADLIAVINNEFGRNFHDVFLGLKMVSQYDL